MNYTIYVTTTLIESGGTDADVYLEIWGTNGSTGEFEIDPPGDSFEQGQTDVKSFDFQDLGSLNKLCVRHDNSGSHPGWHLSHIRVVSETGEEWTFYFNRWLARDEPPYSLSACKEI